MKEITEACGSEAERKLSSPPSAKWPRIDSGDLSVNSRADSPLKAKHLTPVDLQKFGGLTWESEFEDFHTKSCDETVAVAYALHTSAAHSNDSHTGSSEGSFIISEGHQAPMQRTEHPLVPDTEKFKFPQKDYSGGPPTSVNTYSPSSPVHKQQRKSLECASPGSCSFLTGSDEEGTQVQTNIGQTLAVALSSGWFDCANDAVGVEGLCETWSQFAEVEEGNLEEKEHDFIENIPSTAVVSKLEEAVFENLTEGEKKDKELEIWICKSEYPLTVKEVIICSPDVSVEGSILLDVGKKSIDEKVYPDVNNHDEALNATDPAIKVEIVNSFEWMHTYSGSTTDLLRFDSDTLQKVQKSPEESDLLCKEANEASCQSIAQTQACLVTISSSLDMNGNQGNCQPHFSPSVTPGGIQEPEDFSPNAAENQTEEKDKKSDMSKEKLLSPSQQDRYIANQMEGETVKDAGELGKNHDLLCPQPASSDIYVSDMSEEKEVVIDATEEIKAVGCKRLEVSANNGALMPADSRSNVCNASKQEQRLDFSSNGQHRSESSSAEGGDQTLALAIPSASDAVVPCQLDLSPLQSRHPTTALPHQDRCSLLSFSVCSRAVGGFDTFEKVHLSSDDEDDACLIYVPPQPLKATPPLLPYMLVDESACPEDLLLKNLNEEEVKRVKINRENSVTRSDCKGFTHDEAPQIISAPEKPKLQPDGGSACESSQSKTLPAENDTPSCINTSPCTDFDMTEHFSKVLKELNLFFDISCSDFAQPPSPDQYVTDPLENSVLEPKQDLNRPEPDDFRAPSTGTYVTCESQPIIWIKQT